MPRSSTALTDLARFGFADLRASRDRLDALIEREPLVAEFLPAVSQSADPDGALVRLGRLFDRAPDAVTELLRAITDASPTRSDERPGDRLMMVIGASEGLADFLCRRPEALSVLRKKVWTVPHQDDYERDLLAAVAGLTGDEARTALRIAYRRCIVSLAAFDLSLYDPVAGLDVVAAALADLAGAALQAGLDVARREVPFPADEVARTRLAIIAMGKAGARELNYISDVDVIFVAGSAPVPAGDVTDAGVGPDNPGEALDASRAVEIATALAIHTTRTLSDLAPEEPLWEVDANLRPEGKNGALVRTLSSHLAYYERWAKPWEFQALLKARPIAGDLELGREYVERLAPLVWSVAATENFVESVQKMRERVTAHIPADQVDLQLKLGPGGLRDIEFTIQLLQLVHGQGDPEIRQRSTLGALGALVREGYVGRVEAAEFDRDYRELRLLEHRIQLFRMRRTHLMPTGEEDLRILARSSGLATSADGLLKHWHEIKRRVRHLHERLFYRPLLSAVARRPEQDLALSTDSAVARLQAIGFRDPRGALAHIAAMSSGVSRRASIQRHLLPVMLQWFADGTDPDLGLLAFRRLSDGLGESYWFLRMLRDSSGAAHRLTTVLSSSRFVADLLERIPEAASWLEDDEDLRPRSEKALVDENAATVARHDDPSVAAQVIRTSRRREILRLALGAIVGVITVDELGPALSAIMSATIGGALALARRRDSAAFADEAGGEAPRLQFAVIALGRYGGEELGFGSDADVLYVYRSLDPSDTTAQQRATRIVADLHRFTDDPLVPLDLDAELRPEGKNGPLARSLDAYAAYYARWALTWEAQALLRARGAVGDEALLRDFEALADTVRYPVSLGEQDAREVKRIKARVESERLPKGADPSRHLKLGRGSLSDVEWFVQLLQLQHAASVPGLRTPSTLAALAAATDAGLVDATDAEKLRDAWIIASRARSAVMLWTSRTSDVLPTDRRQLEAVARLLEYPPGSATRLEEDYLATTRRARHVFENGFYGVETSPTPSV